MAEAVIYHNPRCSTQLLRDNGIEATVPPRGGSRPASSPNFLVEYFNAGIEVREIL